MGRGFKQWTSEERDASYRKTVRAIRDGAIPAAKELGCHRCGQKEGIVEYHNHNYDHPTKYLEALCYRCHMMLHNHHNNPPVVNAYFEDCWMRKAAGEPTPWPPMHERAFFSMMYDMGVFVRKAARQPMGRFGQSA